MKARPFLAILAICGVPAGCGSGAKDPEAPTGKWAPAAAETSAAIEALPYARGYRPPIDETSGVIQHDRARAQPGLNLLISGHAAQAELLDMEGRERRRWRLPIAQAFPELAGDDDAAKVDYWRRVHLLPEGSLLAIYEGFGVVKLDRASRILWARRGNFHHDLYVNGDGSIWILDRDGKVLPRIHPDKGVLEDFVTRLTPEGEIAERISVLEAFEVPEFASFLAGMPEAGDILHTNTIEVLDGTLADRLPEFRAGSLLVSVLQTSTIAVLDPSTRRIVWALRGGWRKQHQPTVLPTGNLLVFDNTGIDRDHSRVIEIDPRDGSIAWRYGGQPGEELASRTLGSAARLPNGNTLITESERGRAIEVTPDKRIVWEYRSPHRTVVDGKELVASLLEVVRLPAVASR